MQRSTRLMAKPRRNLRTWETESGYLCKVTNSVTGEIIAEGEALSMENTMIGAAQAEGAV